MKPCDGSERPGRSGGVVTAHILYMIIVQPQFAERAKNTYNPINRVQESIFFIIKRRLTRFLNPFYVLRTMVIVPRSNFGHVGSGKGPERA